MLMKQNINGEIRNAYKSKVRPTLNYFHANLVILSTLPGMYCLLFTDTQLEPQTKVA